jgi:hypothetical protein
MDPEKDIDRRAPEDIAASLQRSLSGGAALVGTGQYSPYPEHPRVSVLRVDEGAIPSLVWDRFFPDKALPDLRRALSAFCEVFEGEVDTMYATGWSFAWTVPPAPLRAYNTDGLLMAIEGGIARVTPRSSAAVAVPIGQIESVLGWVSDDWVRRGVSLVTSSGQHVVVAEVEDPFVLIDPTYDGINLLCEAAWAAQMGKALAKGLGVRYVAGDSVLT